MVFPLPKQQESPWLPPKLQTVSKTESKEMVPFTGSVAALVDSRSFAVTSKEIWETVYDGG